MGRKKDMVELEPIRSGYGSTVGYPWSGKMCIAWVSNHSFWTGTCFVARLRIWFVVQIDVWLNTFLEHTISVESQVRSPPTDRGIDQEILRFVELRWIIYLIRLFGNIQTDRFPKKNTKRTVENAVAPRKVQETFSEFGVIFFDIDSPSSIVTYLSRRFGKQVILVRSMFQNL